MREARISLHKIKFLQGDVYHVLGKSYEVSENEAYAAAEDLRRLLLRGMACAEMFMSTRTYVSLQGRRRPLNVL